MLPANNCLTWRMCRQIQEYYACVNHTKTTMWFQTAYLHMPAVQLTALQGPWHHALGSCAPCAATESASRGKAGHGWALVCRLR
jgi:hypothetical protein